MLRGSRSVVLAALVAACAPAQPAAEPPSDPTDAFYRPVTPKQGATPAIRWHDRDPPRRFVSTMRPWTVRAALPTPYLVRITRHHQPWAQRIYDVATMAFRFDDAAPIRVASVAELIALRRNRHAVRLELGGWSQTFSPDPAAHARIFESSVTRIGGQPAVVESAHSFTQFHAPPHGQADGAAVMIHCGPEDCYTDLALVTDWTGARAVSPPHGAGREGMRLGIEFHRAYLGDWPLIRRRSLCLAARSLPAFDLAAAFPRERAPCARVDAAIAAALAETRPSLGQAATPR